MDSVELNMLKRTVEADTGLQSFCYASNDGMYVVRHLVSVSAGALCRFYALMIEQEMGSELDWHCGTTHPTTSQEP